MRRRLAAAAFVLALALAGCEDAAVTPVQGYTLSAPTLAPSPIVDVLALTPESQSTLVVGQNAPTYAGLPSGGELPLLPVGTSNPGAASVPIQVTGADGALLDGDLYTHINDDTRYPAALLINADRAAWGTFPQALRDGGFTVLSMNMRAAMPVDDLLAMIAAFGQVNTMDPGRILIVGAEEPGSAALTACAAGVPCDALALVSPASSPPGAALQFTRPLLLVAAPSDASYAIVQQIQAESRSPMTVLDATGGGRGAALVAADSALAAEVIAWAQAQLGQ
jgi:hypothetical protein